MRIAAVFAVTLIVCGLCSTASVAEDPGALPVARPCADPLSQAALFPWKGDYKTPEDIGLSFEEVFIDGGSGAKLRGWHLPVDGSKQSILFCMGNTGNISVMLPYAQILQQAGFDVLLFDYTGFGESGGVASVLSLQRDANAAFDYLENAKGRRPEDIGVFGVSLGSVLAMSVAAHQGAGAVALEDAFLPSEMVERYQKSLGDDPLVRFAVEGVKRVIVPGVDPLESLKRLKCPLFLMHGVRDRLLPPAGTMTIVAASPLPTRVWMMDNTGHAPESLEVNDLEYAAQLGGFFKDAFAGRVQDPRVTCQLIASSPDRRRHTVRVTIESSAEKPEALQIALGHESGRFQFVRVFVDGTRTLDVSTRFFPSHASAIAFEHVVPTDEESWTPELSELSESLASYQQCARRLFGSEQRVEYLCGYQGNFFKTFAQEFPEQKVEFLLDNLPAPHEVPDRIRPRYARLLARLECWPNREKNLAEQPFAEAMLNYCPTMENEYYEVGNARIELGFQDFIVAEALYRVAEARLLNEQPAEARKLLLQHLRVLPEGAETTLTKERIATIRTLEDLHSESASEMSVECVPMRIRE